MINPTARSTLVLAVALIAVLTVGAGNALAGGKAKRAGGNANATALVTEAAKQLDVTTAKLTTAITAAANARIDEAVEDGDVDREDVADLKERAVDNVAYAMKLSRTKVVATNLSTTTAKLNTAFRAARKAVIQARIDQAVEDGDIDEEEAQELEDELAAAKLPGYKSLRGFGFDLGFGGPGGFGGSCGGGGR